MEVNMETLMERAAFGMAAACQYLDISRPTLYRLIERGDLRSFHVGKKRFCLKSDLDAFIERRLAYESSREA
jgi:excisionase family DNA binding protein